VSYDPRVILGYSVTDGGRGKALFAPGANGPESQIHVYGLEDRSDDRGGLLVLVQDGGGK